ncbi:MAG: GAF domain-containing sensor histidine kinase [Hyphococcus sp.]
MADAQDTMIDQDHLREMIEVISGELELRPLLTTIVQKACELLHADRGSIGLVHPEEDAVRIEAVYKMPPKELGSVAKRGEGLAGRVYRDRAPVLIDRYGALNGPLLKGMDEDIVVGMPIMWRGDIIGTFGIGAAPPKRFGDNDLRTLEVFARHAAIAIHNARSYEREKKFAAVKERQRLARDLHDNVSQLIFSMTLVAQSIGPGYEKNKKEGEARVKRVLEIAGMAQKEMKSLLTELRGLGDDGSMAAYVRRNGLMSGLRRHCDLTAPEGANVKFDFDPGVMLSPLWRETLLRIAQEALSNAFRHGEARSIRIALGRDEKGRYFKIEDDGQGLARQSTAAPGSTHIGKESMRARAVAAGGALTICDLPHGGVCVEARLPETDGEGKETAQ